MHLVCFIYLIISEPVNTVLFLTTWKVTDVLKQKKGSMGTRSCTPLHSVTWRREKARGSSLGNAALVQWSCDPLLWWQDVLAFPSREIKFVTSSNCTNAWQYRPVVQRIWEVMSHGRFDDTYMFVSSCGTKCLINAFPVVINSSILQQFNII